MGLPFHFNWAQYVHPNPQFRPNNIIARIFAFTADTRGRECGVHTADSAPQKSTASASKELYRSFGTTTCIRASYRDFRDRFSNSEASTTQDLHCSDEPTKGRRKCPTPPEAIHRSLNPLPTGRRVIQNITDVNHIHLTSKTFVGGVYGYYPPIRTEARMQIDPVFAIANVHAAVAFQLGKRHEHF